jgi:hypothetical protein
MNLLFNLISRRRMSLSTSKRRLQSADGGGKKKPTSSKPVSSTLLSSASAFSDDADEDPEVLFARYMSALPAGRSRNEINADFAAKVDSYERKQAEAKDELLDGKLRMYRLVEQLSLGNSQLGMLPMSAPDILKFMLDDRVMRENATPLRTIQRWIKTKRPPGKQGQPPLADKDVIAAKGVAAALQVPKSKKARSTRSSETILFCPLPLLIYRPSLFFFLYRREITHKNH